MSISYEEALSTLTSMFSHPWTEHTLDAVLRHHEGHMETTVESILFHGDEHPKLLLLKLNTKQIAEDADEALARMLQDELFSEELQHNPECSHLARDREDVLRQGSYPSIGRSNSLVSGYSYRTDETPGIMEALSELGEHAKKRLALIVSKFNRMNNTKSVSTGRLGGSNTVSEVTGLLEDNDVEQISFTRSRDTDFEMGSMRSAGVTRDKKRD